MPSPLLSGSSSISTELARSPRRVGARRWVAGVLALAACGGLPLLGERPNVLFITVDDLRPELGCYGYAHIRTPNIDRLARQGTVFERAFCQQALCAPSRAAVLTGLRPETTGILRLDQPVRQAVPEVRTLPQHFREAGYTTLSLGKVYHHREDDNGLGWSRAAWMPEQCGAAAIDPANGPVEPGGRPLSWEAVEANDTAYADGQIAARAVAELERLAGTDTPFFLAVGFLKPHLPFFAPKKYWDWYDRRDIAPPTPSSWPTGMPAIAGMNSEELRNYRDVPKSGPIGEDLTRTLIHGYRASISYTDAMIGQLLDALEREGLRNNTIVVLWGDHGYKTADYGAWCKHTNFEVDLHSPLILSAPGYRRGQSSRALVELIDLYPTLAELAGLAIPEHCEGMSLEPWLTNPDQPGKPAVFAVYPHGPAMGRTVRDDRWRYTEWREIASGQLIARELYDHRQTTLADFNLADDSRYQHEVARLEAVLTSGTITRPHSR